MLKKIGALPEVLLIRKSKNYHDVIAIVEHDSMKSLSEFIFQKIRAIDCVKDTETTILIEE
ncbi:MAG: Lrp/AsnC ligand binding domain-containing protein [Candidatus Methanofastidiosa archaeon]|nr:Lrp/AsnC ligand binding domain-containing protein [Candidatus Methanofastidiosa archaeon]